MCISNSMAFMSLIGHNRAKHAFHNFYKIFRHRLHLKKNKALYTEKYMPNNILMLLTLTNVRQTF